MHLITNSTSDLSVGVEAFSYKKKYMRLWKGTKGTAHQNESKREGKEA
jgi:hypothetical protein